MEFVFELFPRLAERRDQAAGTMSGGEAQMLAIARSLLAGPKLLMLDEPSLGLAPVVREDIFHVVQQIYQERRVTILLVEQNAKWALGVANRAYIMENGQHRHGGPGKPSWPRTSTCSGPIWAISDKEADTIARHSRGGGRRTGGRL